MRSIGLPKEQRWNWICVRLKVLFSDVFKRNCEDTRTLRSLFGDDKTSEWVWSSELVLLPRVERWES